MSSIYLRPKFFNILFVLLTGLHWGLPQAQGQSTAVETDHVTARLVSAVSAIQPGQPFEVALRLEIEEHWHTYYKNPGDSGLATSVKWELPEGFEAGEIRWPDPKRLPFGPLTNFGYEGTVLHVFTISPPASLEPGSRIVLKARGDWLVCKEICLPGSADLELELPVTSSRQPPTRWAPEFESFSRNQPLSLGSDSVLAGANSQSLQIVLLETEFSGPLHFFPDQEMLVQNPVEPTVEVADGKTLISIPLADNAEVPGQLAGRLVQPDGEPFIEDASSIVFSVPVGDAVVAAGESGQAAPGLLLALLLGFVGGLILNLMPCVFPVLGIKVMGFVQQAGEDRKKVVAHGLTFTAGVLVSFWILAGILLALRAGGQELGWGFQLQSPGFVFALLVFLFGFGLNLAGVFEVGSSAVGVGSKLTGSGSWSGSFFSGVLATVVATPCAAPFLAPALGAALSLQAIASLSLFTAIALGLAAPYLILSLKPELTRFLPKPGAWMESFKQAMAFPLFGTAAYLLWVLDGQVDENGLLRIFFALALIGLGLWIIGRWGVPSKSPTVQRSGQVIGIVIIAAALLYAWPQAQKAGSVEWVPWSKEREQEMVNEGNIVYVDFTARWCATCQTNKALVFSSEKVIETFQELGVVTMKADWTNQDPAITRELASYNRSAVPFNVIYFPDRDEPEILPEILTPNIVLDAIKRAD